MKTVKIIAFLLFFSGIAFMASACDICGCGVGNFYMGLLPNFENKFIGVRYQYMSYKTVMKEDASEFSNDRYQTIELWGGWNIGSKWRVMAFVPYQVNKLVTDDGNKTNAGPGDITLLANYSLLHKYRITARKKTIEQQWWIGGGLKLGTGKNKVDPNFPDANPGDINAETGTGSTDFLTTTSYNVRVDKWGVNTTVNYKINTTNKNDYYFGNRFTANSLAFYTIRVKKSALAPNAGLLFEHAAVNKLNSEKVDLTGGHALFAMAGLEMNYKKMAAGINAQLPLEQNFADHQTNARFRGMAHVSFAF